MRGGGSNAVILNILQHLVAENHAPALVFPGRVLSYCGLAARVEALADRMNGARRLVALEAQPSEDFVIAYLAALKAGHAVALLAPGDDAARETFHRDFRPEISFRQRDGGWLMEEHAREAGSFIHPDLAVMLATSGTEGRPRWVRLSIANIAANAASIVEYLGLAAADRVPQLLPFHYSYGLSVLNSHLAAGGSLAFCGASVIDDGFVERAAGLGCTGLSGVPFTFELLERIGIREQLWPALRYMTVAGGRLAPELVARYAQALDRHGAAFFVMYGQTEATARMAYLPPDRAAANPDCIGIAIPGGRFRIAAEDGTAITAPGQPGELFYRGPNVMMGYATMRRELGRGAGLGELATGDIAVHTEAGFIRLAGRARRFSKIAGLRIGHEAIEWALRSRDIACAVTGNDEAITIHTEATDEDVARRGAEVAGLPQRYVRLRRHAALPRLASGKIDYRSLAAPETAPPPAAPTERPLLQDFRATFYPRAVTSRDSFDSLEGDSLAYVQVSLAIESRLGGLPDGWESLPIAELETLARGKPQGQPQSRLARIESHLVLRTAAILLVVLHHATEWPIPGGAMTLMMLVGFGFARFHREALFEGRVSAILHPMLRNLLPYFVVVAGFAIAWDRIPWASVFLVGNLGLADPGAHTMLPFQYWFVEAYAQLCLLAALAFSLPPVRQAVQKHPFSIAFAAMTAAFALRYGVPHIYDIGLRKIFLLSYVLWLPLLGWCAFFARRAWQKLVLLAVLAVLAPYAAYNGGNWTGAWVMNLLQVPVLAVLLLAPSLRLPRLAVPAVMLIAASSYHIYLFHRIIPEMLGLDAMGPWGIAASVTVGVASGIAAAGLQRLALTGLSRRASLETREA